MLVELVANFKYLRRPMDQTNNEWPALRRNVKLWSRLSGMLGGYYKKSRYILQSGVNVLQVGDTCSAPIWIG